MKANNKSNKIMLHYKIIAIPKFIIYSVVQKNGSLSGKTKKKIFSKENILFHSKNMKKIEK